MVLPLAMLALLLLLVGIWPFGPYQLSLAVARRLGRFAPVPVPTGPTPESFAVCLCVQNARAGIIDKVEDLLRLREAAGGVLDILIHVDAADDGTTEILRSYGERIRLVVSPERRGRTFGMNRLVELTDAEILLFTDAAMRLDARAIPVLRRYFADPAIGCVWADLGQADGDTAATATVGAASRWLDAWSKTLETATGSVMGVDGSCFAIRRSLHRPVPSRLLDGIHLSLSILAQGARVARAPELRAFERHPAPEADDPARIAGQRLHVHLDLWPILKRLDAWHLYKYVARRLLPWTSGLFLLAGGMLGLAAIAMAIGWPIALAGFAAFSAALALAVRARLAIACKLWTGIVACAATSMAVLRVLRGRRLTDCEVAASV